MRYYVWKPDLKRVDCFSYFKDVPEGLKRFSFCSGEQIVDLPVCDFVTNKSYPTDLSDLLLIGEEIHVISTRLFRVIDSLSIKDLQYFPTRIKNHKTGVTIDYQILNVMSTIACLDLENSEITRSRRSGNVIGLERYKIIEEKVGSHLGNAPLMFRLREFAWHLLVGERFKEACEGEGITGCSFTPTDEYV